MSTRLSICFANWRDCTVKPTGRALPMCPPGDCRAKSRLRENSLLSLNRKINFKNAILLLAATDWAQRAF